MRKNISLIFTPFSSFSYVPLGIAFLKGFIEKNNENIDVVNIDLNNSFYNQLFSNPSLPDHLIALCSFCNFRNMPNKCQGLLKRASNFELKLRLNNAIKEILTNKNSPSWRNFDENYRLLNRFDSFFNEIESCLNVQFSGFLSDKNFELSDPLRELLSEDINTIMKQKPDLLGFSIFTMKQLQYSLVLAKLIKATYGVPVVFGGAYCSLIFAEEILKNFNFVDFIINKEGELGLLKLVAQLSSKKYQDVPSLFYRRHGHIVKNKEAVIKNLDFLPSPDFTNFNINKYFQPVKVISTNISRSCYWKKCTFCILHNTFGESYRVKSIKYIIKEIKAYCKQGIRHIFFADEVISAQKMDEISKAIIKNKIKIFYGFLGRPTKDFSYEILKNMRESGCRLIFWGVENGSPAVIELINKGTNAEDMKNLLKDCHNVKIHSLVGIIFGYPGQNKKNVYENLNFMVDCKKYVDYFSVNRFQLQRGSLVSKSPSSYKIYNLQKTYFLKKNNISVLDFHLLFKYKKGASFDNLERKIEKSIKHMDMPFLNKKYIEHILVKFSED